jgi:hypothetical protein
MDLILTGAGLGIIVSFIIVVVDFLIVDFQSKVSETEDDTFIDRYYR